VLRRPEFVNRVDEFIVFEPLVRSQIRDIVGLRATALVERVAAQHIRMLLGDSALDFLAAKVGCDSFYAEKKVYTGSLCCAKRAVPQRQLCCRITQGLMKLASFEMTKAVHICMLLGDPALDFLAGEVGGGFVVYKEQRSIVCCQGLRRNLGCCVDLLCA
jgi:hypothetical protein